MDFDSIKIKGLRNRTQWILAAVVPLLFLLVFFLWPFYSVIIDGFSLSGITGIIADTYYRKIIIFTFMQALLSTFFAVLLGLPGAYFLSHYNFPGKKIIKAVSTIPFVIPSILAVLGFVLFFGNNGYLNRILMTIFKLDNPPLKILYSLGAIIIAHVFYNFPICIRIVSPVWERISQSRIDAAKSLGAGRIRVFFTVTLHQILPGIAAAAALIFLFSFMSFAVILVLGGGPQYTTIEVEIYRLSKISLDFNSAASLAVISSVISFFILFLYVKVLKKGGLSGDKDRESGSRSIKSFLSNSNIFIIIIVIFYLLLILAVIAAPLISVIIKSFSSPSGSAGGNGPTLKWFLQLFSTNNNSILTGAAKSAIVNSLFFGFMTILISLPLSTIIVYITMRFKNISTSLIEFLFMVPMGVSSIILGLGYIKVLHIFPFDLKGSRIIIIAIHTVIASPFVIRAISTVFQKINPSIREAAASLGASKWEVFKTIEFPLIRSGLITGASFAFAISVGELNASLLLTDSETATIPIIMYRLISSYNFFGACALGVILMLLSFSAFFIIDKFEQKGG